MSRFGTAVLATATTLTATFGLSLVGVSSASAASRPLAAVEASSLTYTVKSGDYLFGIAMSLNVTVGDLLSVNSLTISSAIHPGDTLVVPRGGSLPTTATATPAAPAAVTSAATSTYTVVNGDFLVGIAGRHGVTLKALLSANRIDVTTTIHPGMTLTIPPATLPLPSTSPAPTAPAAATPAVSQPTANPNVSIVGQYTVKRGDYFVAIAAANGVTLKALLAANNMTVATVIVPGMVLGLPVATLPVPSATTTPKATGGSAATATASPAQSGKVAAVLDFLQGELGKPYQFAAAGPDAYDCSGLVVAAFRKAGVSLPHQSLLQSTKGVAVDWHTEDIQAGDLIFQIGSGKTYISHVGIAISATQWIQAAQTGDVVKVSSIPSDSRIAAVQRVIN